MHSTVRSFKLTASFAIAPLAAAIGFAACSSGSSSSPPVPSAAFTPLPVLVPGSRFTYGGTYSETIAYASPSASQPNSTGAYTLTDLEKISKAASGAPAPIDVHQELHFVVTTAPTSGVQPQRRTTDAFESQTVTSTSQTISQAKVITATTGIDATADRTQGNGPYQYHGTETTAYASPRLLLVFPLVTGTTSLNQARTVATDERAANAAGDVYLVRNTTTRYRDSGAFDETGSVGPSETTSVKASANGTGTLVNAGTTQLQIEIGLPTPGPSQSFSIPVSRTSQGVKETYLAADWYPGNGAPPAPLAASQLVVKGQSRIPSYCPVKVPVSDVQEVDTASTALDVIAATYTVGLTRDFLSNGITVCRVIKSTVLAYDLTTGALFSTTVDLTAEGLTSMSIPASP
jgi:hypothetical protein